MRPRPDTSEVWVVLKDQQGLILFVAAVSTHPEMRGYSADLSCAPRLHRSLLEVWDETQLARDSGFRASPQRWTEGPDKIVNLQQFCAWKRRMPQMTPHWRLSNDRWSLDVRRTRTLVMICACTHTWRKLHQVRQLQDFWLLYSEKRKTQTESRHTATKIPKEQRRSPPPSRITLHKNVCP